MVGTDRPRICFVTNELYPLGPGGIGRMLYNFARHNERMNAPAELFYLVAPELVSDGSDFARLDDALGDHATVMVAPRLTDIPYAFAGVLERAASHPWSLEQLLATSYSYYVGLREAERATGRPFDIIEFPDFGGWGFASIEAKRAGLAFDRTILSARLHSTRGMIIRAEKYEHPSIWNGMVCDAERHLLAHADLVVGHVQSVIDANATNYGLSERWRGRSHLEFPPIMLERHELAGTASHEAVGEDTDFIFSSRLQRFKRPDIFVRAAIAFLEKHPRHRGMFRLVSYGWDKDYIAWMQSLVPPALSDRIVFVFDAKPEHRAELLGRSVVVIPSDYESLCLFAFEAVEIGCKVILNRVCQAFGANPRWREQHNCLMFDGSVADLVRVMEDSIDWLPSAGADVEPDAPYWLKPEALEARPDTAPDVPLASLSVVCLASESPDVAEDQVARAVLLERALDLKNGRDEIVFFLPSARFEADGVLSERIRARGWGLQFTSGHEECPEMLRARLTALDRDCVLLWGSGFDIYPDFIARGLAAMARDPQLSIFGGSLEVVDPASGQVESLRAFGGEMPSLALVSGRIAPPISIIRRSLLERTPFDPRAGRFWFEEFTRRMALNRESIVSAPVFAAAMDGPKSLAPETSPRLNAGVMDSFGLAHDLAPRLIGVPVRQLATEVEYGAIPQPQEVLMSARRLLPKVVAHSFDPVHYAADRDGLLVHPVENAPATVAEIIGPGARLSRFDITAHNASAENAGIEAAVARVPKDIAVEDVLATLERPDSLPAGFAMSGWRRLPPSSVVDIDLYLQGTGTGADRMLLMSRLPPGAGEAHAHLIFRNIRVWPVRNTL